MTALRLTPRGERLLLGAYAVGKCVAAAAGIVLLLGIAGWIEGI